LNWYVGAAEGSVSKLTRGVVTEAKDLIRRDGDKTGMGRPGIDRLDV
jgi:hypothetical protein